MTLKEFSEIEKDRKYNELAIRRLREKLLRARERAEKITTDFHEGVSRGGVPSDRVADAVAEIDEIQREIAIYEGRVAEARQRAEQTAKQIDDLYVRTALQYKYADGLTWYQTAMKVGAATEVSLIMLCQRTLAKIESR